MAWLILTVPARSRYFNSRSNVAQGAEVLDQHRDCRVMEDPPELQEQTSSSWWAKLAVMM
jgi:hypothetical protein